jgi:hypothetical protein
MWHFKKKKMVPLIMRKYRLIWAISCFAFFCIPNLALSSNNQSINEIESRLLEMGKEDQSIRKELQQVGFENITEALREKFKQVDQRNTDSLKKIIDKNGWVILSKINKEAKKAFLLIIQHADDDKEFQKSALNSLRKAFKDGYIKGQNVALLVDQILIAEGKPQRYGTQFNVLDGEFVMLPLENEMKVDDYRQELNLPTLAEYTALLKQYYAN